jgi:hypothetical protein
VANEEDIRRAYEEDDPIMIGFSGHHINDSYRVEAVFRLREDAGFKGHTLSPAGYNVRIFRKSEVPFVEITLRKGA